MNNEVQEKIEEGKTETTEQTNGKDIKAEETAVAKQKSPSSNSLSKLTPQQIQGLDYNDFSTPARKLALADILVKGSLCPIKNPSDVFIALTTGEDLGLSLINSITEIYPINGKPTLGVHLMKGLAIKNGILFHKSKDYEPYYMFVEAKDGKPILKDKKPIKISEGFIGDQPENTLKKEIDRVTEYTLERMIKLPNGEWRTITATGSFSLSEAVIAGLAEKDNWKKYPKRMLEARSFAIAGREIADDIYKGLMTADEVSGGNIIIDVETVE